MGNSYRMSGNARQWILKEKTKTVRPEISLFTARREFPGYSQEVKIFLCGGNGETRQAKKARKENCTETKL